MGFGIVRSGLLWDNSGIVVGSVREGVGGWLWWWGGCLCDRVVVCFWCVVGGHPFLGGYWVFCGGEGK